MVEKVRDSGPIQPVILGGDIGAYAIGLEFFEAYGCRSICVANAPVDIITKSAFFDIELINSGCSEPELLAVLRGIAAVETERKLVLLANTDAKVGFIARNRQRLQDKYLLPFPSLETIDLLCRKDSFAQVCAKNGVKTPSTVVVDLKNADSAQWIAPTIPFEFPVVAKAASGDAYDLVQFPGKKKIWFIDTVEELNQLWEQLVIAGYTDKFLVQEIIPGDDTQMRSLTLYVDSHGNTTMFAAARVLLEDPSPTMIGNPVAMITDQLPHLWEDAGKILKSANYQGFANFDIKIDPRDGTPYFFEVNPRIGRNSYYVSAAGVNPMAVMVEDLFLGKTLSSRIANQEVLYSLVPVKLIEKYLHKPELINEIKALEKEKKVYDPLESSLEGNWRRRVIVKLQKMNYYRKFKKYYRH